MATKRQDSKPDAEKVVNAKPVDRQYLCPGKASVFFYIPVRDEDGKPVPDRDKLGNQKFSGANPVFKTQLCRFEQISSAVQLTENYKTMCGYLLRADDPQYADKFDVLEKLRLDPSNMVMDNAMYEKWRNPEAADAVIENRQLRTELSEKTDAMASMQAQIDALQAELAASKKSPQE